MPSFASRVLASHDGLEGVINSFCSAKHYGLFTKKMYAIILHAEDKWVAPEWVVRNLVAHLAIGFGFCKTQIAERFEGLLVGTADSVDLSAASPAEMQELLSAAEFGRRSLNRPSQWADPAAALETVAAYDQFLALLRRDERTTEKSPTL
jgi:hypothetical protein